MTPEEIKAYEYVSLCFNTETNVMYFYDTWGTHKPYEWHYWTFNLFSFDSTYWDWCYELTLPNRPSPTISFSIMRIPWTDQGSSDYLIFPPPYVDIANNQLNHYLNLYIGQNPAEYLFHKSLLLRKVAKDLIESK